LRLNVERGNTQSEVSADLIAPIDSMSAGVRRNDRARRPFISVRDILVANIAPIAEFSLATSSLTVYKGALADVRRRDHGCRVLLGCHAFLTEKESLHAFLTTSFSQQHGACRGRCRWFFACLGGACRRPQVCARVVR
jgi:hypothetical protein